MADIKYGGFVLKTILKLAVYLVICGGTYLLCGRFAPSPADKIVPVAIAVIVSWFFLTYIEQGKRSFFAKGYMVENIMVGAFAGVLLFVVPMAVEWVLGGVTFSRVNTDFDIREPLTAALTGALFTGIVIYGYFFHIIKSDFGSVPAVIISAMLFTVSPMNDLYNFVKYDDIPVKPVFILNMFLTGIAAGLIILYQGDMRSACGLLCLFRFSEKFVMDFLDITSPMRGNTYYLICDVYGSIIYSAAAVIICIWLIAAAKKRE